MRKTIFYILPSLLFTLCFLTGTGQVGAEQAIDRMQQKADSALMYCKAAGMNTDFCILVDMRVHSGLKRMKVWDFATGEVVLSSLCCHGYGGESTASTPSFSNLPGSYCTSKGKYRIGVRAPSRWGIGIHYKLHGLEPTNNNAYKRVVVLHSFDPVPETEIYPFYLTTHWSQGCPVISNETMKAIDKKISTTTNKSILLWIYY